MAISSDVRAKPLWENSYLLNIIEQTVNRDSFFWETRTGDLAGLATGRVVSNDAQDAQQIDKKFKAVQALKLILISSMTKYLSSYF